MKERTEEHPLCCQTPPWRSPSHSCLRSFVSCSGCHMGLSRMGGGSAQEPCLVHHTCMLSCGWHCCACEDPAGLPLCSALSRLSEECDPTSLASQPLRHPLHNWSFHWAPPCVHLLTQAAHQCTQCLEVAKEISPHLDKLAKYW